MTNFNQKNAATKTAHGGSTSAVPTPSARHGHHHVHCAAPRSLRVMKFGGTSVGDAACMRRVVDIIERDVLKNDLIVVVSAMSGVTNKLIESAQHAAARDHEQAKIILEALHAKHEIAVCELIPEGAERDRLLRHMAGLFLACQGWCEEIARLGQLNARVLDSVSSLGERLSAPLIASALKERGIEAEGIEATDLVATNFNHGAADPLMDLTQERCGARLAPLLRAGVVPVVTGFIGATADGVLTTLGRGGSDYSATIVGAVLAADEVTIWTDVDGMLTSDPHLVPCAVTIPEISYREAAELAHFGAKVLHPKTLQPVMDRGIPVWVRNTFAPEGKGTKIVPDKHHTGRGVKAITATREAALVTVQHSGQQDSGEMMRRVKTAAAAVRADVLMLSHAPVFSRVCLVVAAKDVEHTLASVRREFVHELAADESNRVTVDLTVSILTVVGQNVNEIERDVERAMKNLSQKNVAVLATGRGASACNISFVVERMHLESALLIAHRELNPGAHEAVAISRAQAQA